MIFLDANILLRFFDFKDKELRQVLNSLVAIKDEVFITRQVADEIQRNKLNKVRDSVKAFIKEDTGADMFNELATWFPRLAKDLRAIAIKYKDAAFSKNNKYVEDAENIFSTLLGAVSAGDDGISIAIGKLVEQSVVESPEELDRARLRRERGNPPGKKNDPLGDQLTWEQVLSRAKESKPAQVWVCSADKDYLIGFNGKFHLNPFLQSELVASLPAGARIHCSSYLSDTLEDVRNTKRQIIKDLPTSEAMATIKKEEERTRRRQFTPEMFAAFTGHCFVCDSDQFGGGLMVPSPFGGFGTLYECTKCHSQYYDPYE